jgi:hypothetical protein
MECKTGTGFVFDLGSLYAHFRTLTDRHKTRCLRYRLETVMTLMANLSAGMVYRYQSRKVLEINHPKYMNYRESKNENC